MKTYAKGIIAILTAALVALASSFPEYANEAQVAISILGALLVYLVPNAPAE